MSPIKFAPDIKDTPIEELWEVSNGRSKEKKHLLVQALQERGLDHLAVRAAAGEFSDLGSPHATPMIELVQILQTLQQHELAQRAKAGEFDHDR